MTTSPVTLSRKRYTARAFVCIACDLLAESSRSHAISCSPRCRVWLHRHPERLERITSICESYKITLASAQEAAAIRRLRPDLADQIMAGELEIADVRAEVHREFVALVMESARTGTP